MLGTRLFSITSTIVIGCRRRFCTTQVTISTKGVKKEQKFESCKPNAKTKWTDQQKQIISAVQEGKSVFISGSAGTGKTFLVQHIIKLLRKLYKPSEVYATGSTGVAACAINGQTLHSFAGVGLSLSEALMEKILANSVTSSRWRKVKALIIDEISMVDGESFQVLERVARLVRGVDSPWGGVQLVVSGDFFQLPPVSLSKEGDKGFAFEANCWNSSFALQVELHTVFRQSDPRIIELLQGIRRGECDPEGLKLLREKCCTSEPLDSSVVELYPRNIEVKTVNELKLKSLNKEEFVYRAIDAGKLRGIRELKKGIAPDEISLREGARVMLIKNLRTRRKLVNGAVGTVVGFQKTYRHEVGKHGMMPEVKFDSGLTIVIEPYSWIVEEGGVAIAERMQIPLVLAWSVSIHKCQGMTLDSLRTNLYKAFGFGMVYVALSRVRSLEGLHLSGFHPSKIKAHPKVVQFYENLAKEQGPDDGD